MKQYKDGMDFKNRFKRTPNHQIDYYDDFEWNKDAMFENDEQEHPFDNLDSRTRGSLNYINDNNEYVGQWDYRKLDNVGYAKLPTLKKHLVNTQPKYTLDLEVKKPDFLVVEHFKSKEKYNIPKYSPDLQIKKISPKYESENMKIPKFIYLYNQSESGEVKKYDIETKQVHMPEMEKTQAKNKSKLET